ncbi:hypothetical protein ACLOJK_000450 [Asimina triloba]
MAYFRNYGNGTESGHFTDDEAQDDVDRVHTEAGNGDVDASSSDKDVEMKVEGRYRSDEELTDQNDSRVQNATDVGNATVNGMQNLQPPGRRTALGAKWGSSFWKDFQPMPVREGSESEQDSKIVDSDYKSDAGSHDNSSDAKKDRLETQDDDMQKDAGEVQRGHADVPADEMLSDDYYEQDGDEQSDSLHHRDLNQPRVSNSRQLSRPIAVNKNVPRNKKSAKFNDYDYDDEDGEEDYDEDDPDDADFEPDDVETGSSMKNKVKGWGSDDFDDDDDYDDNDDNDDDISDEIEAEFVDNPRCRRQPKGGRSLKPVRGGKSSSVNKRKKGRMVSEEEYSSEGDSEKDTDEDSNHRTKKGGHIRKKAGGRSTMYANIISQDNEVRTSSRSVRKVSYVESEESEEIDEGKMKKFQKSATHWIVFGEFFSIFLIIINVEKIWAEVMENDQADDEKDARVFQDDAEEDDTDTIERVLWHQPKGMSEDALRNNKSIQPIVLSNLLDSETDWNELSGFKKVLNYMKRVTEETKLRRTLSREEVEVHDVSKEMELDLLKQYSQVERIFADRISKVGSDDLTPEYLVKWQGLSYAEATWEKDTDISFGQDAIDDYKEDQTNQMSPNRSNI